MKINKIQFDQRNLKITANNYDKIKLDEEIIVELIRKNSFIFSISRETKQR